MGRVSFQFQRYSPPAAVSSAVSCIRMSNIPHGDDDVANMQLFACGRAHFLLPKVWSVSSEAGSTLVAEPPARNWKNQVSPMFVSGGASALKTTSAEIANKLGASQLTIGGVPAFYSTGERDGDVHHSYVLPKQTVVLIVTMSFRTGEVDSEEANDYLRSILPLFFEGDE